MLYQKGTQRIEVIVRKEGGATDTGAKETSTENVAGSSGESGGGGSSFLTALTGSSSKQRQMRVLKTNATHALAVSKQIFDLGIEYTISGLGMQYGDQAYQQNVERRYEILNDTTNVASSIAMGALYGSWGGPIGAVLGATFGALSSGVSLAVKYQTREREYNYKVFKEEAEIEYKRARASINLTTGRLR